jgi:hypothetical protein
VDRIWYGSFGNAEGRCVVVRDEDSAKACHLALFTLDPQASTAQVVERYPVRWPVEPSNAARNQQIGVGQARNRVQNAAGRTVPSAMLIQSMVIIWYGPHGYHPGDITARRRAEPWYDTKTEPPFPGQAHQAPPHPDRRPIYCRPARSTQPRPIARLRLSLRRGRCVSAKHERDSG